MLDADNKQEVLVGQRVEHILPEDYPGDNRSDINQNKLLQHGFGRNITYLMIRVLIISIKKDALLNMVVNLFFHDGSDCQED